MKAARRDGQEARMVSRPSDDDTGSLGSRADGALADSAPWPAVTVPSPGRDLSSLDKPDLLNDRTVPMAFELTSTV